jgi:hypothetical protein
LTTARRYDAMTFSFWKDRSDVLRRGVVMNPSARLNTSGCRPLHKT